MADPGEVPIMKECTQCGPIKIIPNMPLTDKYGDTGFWTASLDVQVHGSPDAWVFKDTTVGHLRAFICGECGYTELRTTNSLELYEKYRKSLGMRD